jgi:hypothetical protein
VFLVNCPGGARCEEIDEPLHLGQEVDGHGRDHPRRGVLDRPGWRGGRDQAALDGHDPAAAQGDGTFKKAKVVFTESDERCGLTAELDGVKKEGVPLSLDLEQLEDAKTSAGARAQLKEALRLYFRKVLGR